MGDVMLLGILRMPWETSTIHQVQLQSACLEAADRIEADAVTIAELLEACKAIEQASANNLNDRETVYAVYRIAKAAIARCEK